MLLKKEQFMTEVSQILWIPVMPTYDVGEEDNTMIATRWKLTLE